MNIINATTIARAASSETTRRFGAGGAVEASLVDDFASPDATAGGTDTARTVTSWTNGRLALGLRQAGACYHTPMLPTQTPTRSLRRRVANTVLAMTVLVFLGAAAAAGFLYLRPAVDPPLADEIAIVVSPHPDDEAYAMGATIAEQTLAGKRVVAVLLTDGDASGYFDVWAQDIGRDMDGDGDIDRWDFGLVRREEFSDAMDVLGAEEIVFLGASESQGATGLRDTKLDAASVEAALLPIAERFADATWFTTARHLPERRYRGDYRSHPDHDATADAVESLASDRGEDVHLFKVYVFYLPKYGRFAPQRIAASEEALEL
ncbi:MAG: PIG-L family deacetylase, partial [Coriobacteriia bacterium]|nr:PIG-L family deacetylase [Coriobacteriia bacterium]